MKLIGSIRSLVRTRFANPGLLALQMLLIHAPDGVSQGTSPPMGLHPGYQLVNIPLSGFNKAFTGMAFLPDGKLVAVTYRSSMDKPSYQTNPFRRTEFGQVYLLENIQGEPAGVRHTLIADSLIDAMGVCVVEGKIYIGDLNRILRLEDRNGDGKYETKETVGEFPAKDGWFEYAFGPIHKDGYLYMGLGVHTKQSGEPEVQLVQDRGTLIRIPVTGGKYEVVARGIRNPDGIGLGPKNEIFVSDNQGGWRPASAILHVQPGKFYGYRSTGDTFTTPVTPPSIWLPHGELNNSPTELVPMKAGRYPGQFLYGDFANQKLFRAFLDPVNDTYQGAVFPVTGGLRYAAHRMAIDDQGVIYIGGIVLTGGTTGPQKLVPKPAAEVFEMLAIRARQGGLEIEFSQPVGSMAARKGMYALQHWGYKPTSAYGGTKQETATLPVSSLQISADSTRVFLAIGGLAAGKVVQVSLSDSLKSRSGRNLWFKDGFYTLNTLSNSPPLAASPRTHRVASPAMSVRNTGDAIQFQWEHDRFATLRIRNVQGQLLGQYDVSGRNSFRLPRKAAFRQLLVVQLEGKSASASAVAVPGL